MSGGEAEQRILGRLDRDVQELATLCSTLIQIDSSNPPGDTRAVAAFVTAYLRGVGVDAQEYAPQGDRPNIVGGMGPRTGPSLVLNSHLDTFPPAAGSWTHAPFAGVIDGGRIYGCGATDMRAGIAASLYIARVLAEEGIALGGRVTFSFSSDEETGGRWGSEWLLANVPEMRADACLIGDQSGTWAAGVGEKGFCWLRVKSAGRRGHAAYGSADSAVPPLLSVLDFVLQMAGQRGRPEPGQAEDAAACHRSLQERSGELAGLADRVTVNVGTLEAGTSPNLVADAAAARLDIRLPLGVTADEVLGATTEAAAKEGARCRVDVLGSFDATLTPVEDPFVQTVLSASEDVLAHAALPIMRIGASDARFFRGAGIPTVVFGAEPNNLGAVDEYVTVEELLRVAKVHAATTLRWCGSGRASEEML